jgi:hypothetical protein
MRLSLFHDALPVVNYTTIPKEKNIQIFSSVFSKRKQHSSTSTYTTPQKEDTLSRMVMCCFVKPFTIDQQPGACVGSTW